MRDHSTFSMLGGSVSNCTGLTAAANATHSRGGFLFLRNGSTATLTGIGISFCSADSGGVAYLMGGSRLTVDTSSMVDCHSRLKGGAIYARESSVVTVTNTRLSGLKSMFGGVAWLAKDSLMEMEGSNVSDCSATNDAGFVDVADSHLVSRTISHV